MGGLNPGALDPGTLDPDTLPAPVWVVAPHPDDEALGCGALLAALAARGVPVWALLLTDGGFSHPASRDYPRARLAALRLREWRAGLAHLGVPPARTRALALPDGALEGVPPARLQAAVEGAFAEAPPGTALLPWRRDPHPDHRAAWGPVWAAAPGARRLEYTVWLDRRGGTGDWPRADETRELRFDTAPWRAAKAAAVQAHASQLGAVIPDDPGGFVLPQALIERALQEERYFEQRSDASAFPL